MNILTCQKLLDICTLHVITLYGQVLSTMHVPLRLVRLKHTRSQTNQGHMSTDIYGLVVCIAVTTAPVIEHFPGAMTVEEGKRVEFKVLVKGIPPPSYKWYHDDQRIEEDYAHEVTEEGCLIVVTAEEKHRGMYKLVAENVAGVTEKSLTLVVIQEKMDVDTAPLVVNGGSATAPGQLSLDAIPVEEFGQHVANWHANNNKGFQSLYNVSGLCVSVCLCVCMFACVCVFVHPLV